MHLPCLTNALSRSVFSFLPSRQAQGHLYLLIASNASLQFELKINLCRLRLHKICPALRIRHIRLSQHFRIPQHIALVLVFLILLFLPSRRVRRSPWSLYSHTHSFSGTHSYSGRCLAVFAFPSCAQSGPACLWGTITALR